MAIIFRWISITFFFSVYVLLAKTFSARNFRAEHVKVGARCATRARERDRTREGGWGWGGNFARATLLRFNNCCKPRTRYSRTYGTRARKHNCTTNAHRPASWTRFVGYNVNVIKRNGRLFVGLLRGRQINRRGTSASVSPAASITLALLRDESVFLGVKKLPFR